MQKSILLDMYAIYEMKVVYNISGIIKIKMSSITMNLSLVYL